MSAFHLPYKQIQGTNKHGNIFVSRYPEAHVIIGKIYQPRIGTRLKNVLFAALIAFL